MAPVCPGPRLIVQDSLEELGQRFSYNQWRVRSASSTSSDKVVRVWGPCFLDNVTSNNLLQVAKQTLRYHEMCGPRRVSLLRQADLEPNVQSSHSAHLTKAQLQSTQSLRVESGLPITTAGPLWKLPQKSVQLLVVIANGIGLSHQFAHAALKKKG